MGIIAVITAVLVVSFADRNFSTGTQAIKISGSSSSVVSSFPSVIVPQSAVNQSPALVLHSMSSAEKILNRTLILPSAGAVAATDASLRLVGVRIDDSSRTNWRVGIYYSSQSFINGSTTIQELVGTSGFAIVEVAAPPGVNSSESARAQLNSPAPKVCRTISSSTVQCETLSGSANVGSNIVVQNGLSIIVNPYGKIVSWTDDRRLVSVGIGGGSTVSITQLLSLAATMTSG